MILPPPPRRVLPSADMSLHDVEAVRKVLRGGSVIDWDRLALTNRDEVGVTLRAAGFRVDRDDDRKRLRTILDESTAYLERELGFDIPAHLSKPERVSDVFLAAATPAGTDRRMACAILKVMHIVHRLGARELRHCLAVSDRELFDQVEKRVAELAAELREEGMQIVELTPSIKERDSIITKLLSKQDAFAAHIYDRLRFRLITRRREDIVPLLRHLTARLFPFNYVVPSESRNDIIDYADMLAQTPGLAPYLPLLQKPIDDGDRRHPGELNQYSGRQYHMIAFVAGVPVRVENVVRGLEGLYARLGPVVYVQAEFQVFDEATWLANGKGDASHASYKARQRDGVLRRLVRDDA